jgi:hypothetical protein
MAGFQGHQVKVVRISLSTLVCTDFRTRQATYLIFRDRVEPKLPSKSSRVRTTKTGGSDPGNCGLNRPKFCFGSLPPCCWHVTEAEEVTSNGINQDRMRTLIMCACRKGRPDGNSQSST